MTNRKISEDHVGSPPKITGHSLSWTDDLPVCHLSGVGFSTNQIYREDGNRHEEHDFEDRSFHFRLDNGCFLYGLFDGHEGCKASSFATQRMPAELLFGQLVGRTTDEQIEEVLRQAFIAVDKAFFESIDDLLAEKTNVHLQLPEGLSAYEAYRQYPEVVNRLQQLNTEISGGTTAVLALIYNGKLYVANTGDSRALLCKTDEDGILRVIQLSEDHILTNENEVLRLAQLGLDVETLKQQRKIGASDNTRCIGDYFVKGGYKDIDILSSATKEPVIAEPSVQGGIPLDSTCCFLLLVSDGLYTALQDASCTDRVNADIVSMVINEFAMQSTLNGVAQAVVDKVVRIHHDTYMTNFGELKLLCQKRGDITLLVRNINYPLPNAISSPTSGARLYNPAGIPIASGGVNNKSPVSNPGAPQVRTSSLPTLTGLNQIALAAQRHEGSPTQTTSQPGTPTNSGGSGSGSGSTTQSSQLTAWKNSGITTARSTNSTQSSGDSRSLSQRNHGSNKLELDENGCVEAYVDFSEFYESISEMTEVQRDAMYDDLKPRSIYEPVPEEEEPMSPDIVDNIPPQLIPEN